MIGRDIEHVAVSVIPEQDVEQLSHTGSQEKQRQGFQKSCLCGISSPHAGGQ